MVIPIAASSVEQNKFAEWPLISFGKDIEIILVKDQNVFGEFPRNADLISFQENSNVKVLSGVFKGPGLARNAGLEICSGEWVAFWDSDDCPNIEDILIELSQIEEFVDILVGQYKVTDNAARRTSPGPHAEHPSDLALNPGLWRMVFKKDEIRGVRFPEGRMGEDQEFLIDLRYWEKEIKFVHSFFYEYFKNQSLQLTAIPENIGDLRPIFKRTLKQLKAEPRNVILRRFTSRQLITILKRGNLGLRLRMAQDFISVFKIQSPFFLAKLITQFREVISSKVISE